MAKKTKKGKKGKFKYQSRDASSWKQHAQESAGNFDRYVLDSVNRFAPRDGSNRIRILPPTWKDAGDWAYRIFMHYGVGPDEQSYLCPKMMREEACPVCDEVSRLAKSGENDDAKKLKYKKRFGTYLIDRKAEDEGVQFWAMPFTVWQGANIAAEDEDGEILEFDHPDNGYDLLFKKEGSRDRTKYVGTKLTRKSSPISDDEDDQDTWCAFIKVNKLPDILKFYDPEYIGSIFDGEASDDDEDEDEDLDDEDLDEEDEDEDEDEDDDADEDEDEDEDDEDEDEDEDEDDEDEDEDEDDEDEDEDEDDEDEEPKKKKKKKKKKKSKGTKRLASAGKKKKKKKRN